MRAAKALTGLPEIAAAAMSEGELTFSKARALTRLAHHVDAEAEAELVAIAREIPTAQVEKLIREWRYLVFLHVDSDTLSEDAEPGRSNLEDGIRVSAEPRSARRRQRSRRLCCDASTVRVIRSDEGEVLDVGRRTRTAPPALRRALEIRDGGCRLRPCGP